MASNLSSIGFTFQTAEEFQAVMLKLAPDAIERVSCDYGDYSIWRSRTGAEVWFHIPVLGTEDEPRDIAGLTPFYEGLGEITVEITERINRPGDNPFEGAFTAQVYETGSGEPAYPLTFDAVDFAAHATRVPPFKARARITGFARNLRAFPDQAAYAAAGASEGGVGIALAPRAFIPVGQLLETDPEADDEPPASTAVLTGTVVEHRSLVNEATGQAFHWLLVESLAATYDIVADPQIVEGQIVEGGTVEAGCVLIGRLIEAA